MVLGVSLMKGSYTDCGVCISTCIYGMVLGAEHIIYGRLYVHTVVAEVDSAIRQTCIGYTAIG